MLTVKAIFAQLDGLEYDAATLRDAVVKQRRRHVNNLSAEYTVTRLIDEADRAGWLKRPSDKPLRVIVNTQ